MDLLDGFDYSTDKYLDNRILVSAQVWRKTEWLEKVLPLLPYILAVEKVLQIYPIEFRFASLRSFEGLAYEGGRYAEIDIKGDIETIKTTIAHEAIHCLQFQTKRCFHKDGEMFWEGKVWKCPRGLKGYDAYRAEPHEVEAYKYDVLVKEAAEELLKESECQQNIITTKRRPSGAQTTT